MNGGATNCAMRRIAVAAIHAPTNCTATPNSSCTCRGELADGVVGGRAQQQHVDRMVAQVALQRLADVAMHDDAFGLHPLMARGSRASRRLASPSQANSDRAAGRRASSNSPNCRRSTTCSKTSRFCCARARSTAAAWTMRLCTPLPVAHRMTPMMTLSLRGCAWLERVAGPGRGRRIRRSAPRQEFAGRSWPDPAGRPAR